MRKLTFCIAFILVPLWASAQTIITQGAFAMELSSALGLGTAAAPAEAEDRLINVGIAPQNGWSAGQPMTPASLDEIEDSLIDAAAENKIPVKALKGFLNLMDQYDLAGSDEESYDSEAPSPAVPPPPNYADAYPGYGQPLIGYYPFADCPYPGLYSGVYPYYGGWLSDRWYAMGNHLGIGGKMMAGPICSMNTVWPRTWIFGRGTRPFNGSVIWSFTLTPGEAQKR